jgi:hypothetical protein
MPIEPKYIPLAGALALVPVLVYVAARPELGAILAIPSTVLIVLSVWLMLRGESESRGKVYGSPR